MSNTFIAEPTSDSPPHSAAPNLPTWAFCVAVLAIQLGFILSFVGAFHSPTPHNLSLQIVAPDTVAESISDRFDAAAGTPVDARVASSRAEALADVKQGRTSGMYDVDTSGTTDTLTVASAGGTSVSEALERIATAAGAQNGRTVTVQDAVPLQERDGNGLTGFYLVVGWIIGGYLLAAVLGITGGAKLSSLRDAAVRLAVFVPYAVASGLGGALIVGPVLGALDTSVFALTLAGTVIVLSSAYTTVALQSMFGIIGIAITIVVFVVLGNPSAGGAYQSGLLPPFWRFLTDAVPNGAGTDLVRRIVYFDSAGIGLRLGVLFTWLIAGAAVTIAVTVLRSRRVDRAMIQ